MKLHDPALNIEMQGEARIANFGMKHTRKSFHMVTSGIYSNKIRAIVRELSTNAWDSHESAGKKDVPFKVHLPNSLEPYFSVTDDGIGMSEQFVYERYIIYFDSDKTHTDNQTGCFGLGSKTPFMCSDSYTTRSRHNGKVKVYTSYFDNDGLPAIAKMGEEDTDEPNGVEVSFPVKSEDFYKFQIEAAGVLSWFTPRPIVTGCADFEFSEPGYIKKSKNYGVTKSHRGHSNLIMGNVSYPVGEYDVSLEPLERKVISHGVDIFVPMGEGVEITIGREKLSYTDGTVAVVKKHIAEVLESIKKEVEDEFEKAPTLWQARRMLHDFRHSIIGQVKSLVSVKWRGQSVTDFVKIDDKPTLQTLSKRKQKYMRHESDTLLADGSFIFHNDIDWGGYSRITNYLHEQGETSGYVLTDFDQEFLDATGVGEVLVKASSLPKPARTKSARTFIKKHTAKLLRFNYGNSSSPRDLWEADDVEMSDGGVYIAISHYCPTDKDGNKFSTPVLRNHLYQLKRLLDDDVVVYGIRKLDVPKLKKYGNWIEFNDYVNQVLRDNEDFCGEYLRREQLKNVQKDYAHYLKETFDDGSSFGEFLDEYREAKNADRNDCLDAFMYLNERFPTFKFKEDAENKLASMEEQVCKDYPLFRQCGWGSSSSFARHMSEYIRAKDANPDLEIEPLSEEKVTLLDYLDWDHRDEVNFITFIAGQICGGTSKDASKYGLLRHLRKNDSGFIDSLVEYVQVMTNAEDEVPLVDIAV